MTDIPKRYHDLLTTRLEQVLDAGHAFILKEELRRWYGKQKIAARTYRDLEARWQELTEDESGQLMRVSTPSGFHLLAEHSLQPISKEVDED